MVYEKIFQRFYDENLILMPFYLLTGNPKINPSLPFEGLPKLPTGNIYHISLIRPNFEKKDYQTLNEMEQTGLVYQKQESEWRLTDSGVKTLTSLLEEGMLDPRKEMKRYIRDEFSAEKGSEIMRKITHGDYVYYPGYYLKYMQSQNFL